METLILNPTIEFPAGDGSGLISVRISCGFEWSALMRLFRPTLNLEVYLRGNDRRKDDRLPRQDLFHPELLDNPIKPNGELNSEFDRTYQIRGEILNEDDGIFNKRDEIYAALVLVFESGVGEEIVARARTNTAKGYFS